MTRSTWPIDSSGAAWWSSRSTGRSSPIPSATGSRPSRRPRRPGGSSADGRARARGPGLGHRSPAAAWCWAAGRGSWSQRIRSQPDRRSPTMPGTIVAVAVEVGDAVAAGDVLVVMEAMKMELSVTASVAGVVTAVPVAEGDSVEAGAALVVVDETDLSRSTQTQPVEHPAGSSRLQFHRFYRGSPRWIGRESTEFHGMDDNRPWCGARCRVRAPLRIRVGPAVSGPTKGAELKDDPGQGLGRPPEPGRPAPPPGRPDPAGGEHPFSWWVGRVATAGQAGHEPVAVACVPLRRLDRGRPPLPAAAPSHPAAGCADEAHPGVPRPGPVTGPSGAASLVGPEPGAAPAGGRVGRGRDGRRDARRPGHRDQRSRPPDPGPLRAGSGLHRGDRRGDGSPRVRDEPPAVGGAAPRRGQADRARRRSSTRTAHRPATSGRCSRVIRPPAGPSSNHCTTGSATGSMPQISTTSTGTARATRVG